MYSKAQSFLEKSPRCKCCLCNYTIGYSWYGTCTTRTTRYKNKSFKGETLYFHKDCYEKLLPKNKRV